MRISLIFSLLLSNCYIIFVTYFNYLLLVTFVHITSLLFTITRNVYFTIKVHQIVVPTFHVCELKLKRFQALIFSHPFRSNGKFISHWINKIIWIVFWNNLKVRRHLHPSSIKTLNNLTPSYHSFVNTNVKLHLGTLNCWRRNEPEVK